MKIKVACPHGTVTGGIELLHQVVAELNKYDDIHADLWYMVGYNVHAIPDEYAAYGNTVNNRVDTGDILLFPEIWASYTTKPMYSNYRKVVYWEGVNAYFPHTMKDLWGKFGEGTLHISQSEYSNRFLADTLGIKDFIEVTDYINDDFLNCDITGKREKIVLYNPTKGMEFTEKVIALAPDITFKPITGMKRQQILDLMRKSMVWIDFGSFPGKDRLPREAGACGMCLITSMSGTARYHKDLAIPSSYKFNDVNYADIGAIIGKIRDIFDNFEERQQEFEEYRETIKLEKARFQNGIRQLVEALR